MSGIISVALLLIIVVSSSWIHAKLFSILYLIAISPSALIVYVITKILPEKQCDFALSVFKIISMPYGYYIACIWPAFIVSWIIIPNESNATWWLYLIAYGGFITTSCLDTITILAFAIFCFKPELINLLYGWVPFNFIFYKPII